MKKKLSLAIIIGGAVLLAGCSSGNKNTSAPVAPSQTSSPSQSQTVQPETASNMITIQSFAFSPSTLTIKAGTMVTWTNNDSAAHTIKSNSFSSGNMANGDKFQFTFTSPGTFSYSCGIHPSMKGTIIVQ